MSAVPYYSDTLTSYGRWLVLFIVIILVLGAIFILGRGLYRWIMYPTPLPFEEHHHVHVCDAPYDWAEHEVWSDLSEPYDWAIMEEAS